MGFPMSDATYHAPRGIFAVIGGFFANLGQANGLAASADRRFHELQKLNAKSDAELSEMGLSRTDIPHHVFRDVLYI